jgi:hypothetical protein
MILPTSHSEVTMGQVRRNVSQWLWSSIQQRFRSDHPGVKRQSLPSYLENLTKRGNTVRIDDISQKFGW